MEIVTLLGEGGGYLCNLSSKGGLFAAFESSSIASKSPAITSTAPALTSSGINGREPVLVKAGSVAATDFVASRACGSPAASVDQSERTRFSTVSGPLLTWTSMRVIAPVIPTVNV
jgi:hypothetical protein